MDWSEEKRETYSGRSEIHCSPSITTLFKRLGVTACKHIHIYQIQNKQTQVRSHTLHTHTQTLTHIPSHSIPTEISLLHYSFLYWPLFLWSLSGLSIPPVSLSLSLVSFSCLYLVPLWSLSVCVGLNLSFSMTSFDCLEMRHRLIYSIYHHGTYPGHNIQDLLLYGR